MQSFLPTGAFNPNNHTLATVMAALRGTSGSRRVSFRYELQDLTGAVVFPALDNVLACKVEQNWLADIKRTASFVLRDNGKINYLSDRIKPFIRFHLPPFGTMDWVEWPQGLFTLVSPTRGDNADGLITRDVQAYDLLQIFDDDRPTGRYSVAAATNIITAVTTLLGTVAKNVTTHSGTMTTTREWEPGTSKLRIINDLLGMVNYKSLAFDANGVALVQPYVAAASRTEEYTYDDSNIGLIVPEVDQTLDLFSIANHWTAVVSEPDRPELIASYTNTDPGSPTSTVRRGRTITEVLTEVEVVDLTTLQAMVARRAFEASQVYEAIDFTTGMMPVHAGDDVYRINYGNLAINAKFSEQTWGMELKAGATMKHRARRVVSV